MSRREQKKDVTEKQILSAAAALFTENGYDNTSIEDITAKADVAKGTFYYHFASKEAIVIALLTDSLLQTSQTALNALEKGDKPLDVLERVLLERAAWTEENPEITKVFFEQRIHQFLFREDDPVVLSKSNKPVTTDNTNGDKSGNSLPPNGTKKTRHVTRFFELIRELVEEAQKNKDLRQDLDATELTQIIIATFLHAEGSWLGAYRGTSLVDKVHRWIHAILDGLYA